MTPVINLQQCCCRQQSMSAALRSEAGRCQYASQVSRYQASDRAQSRHAFRCRSTRIAAAAVQSSRRVCNPKALSAQESSVSSDKIKVAVIGIGLMGSKYKDMSDFDAVGPCNKIARRLAEQGCKVAAWNRDGSKTAALSEAGIAVHHSAADAIAASDILVLMLSDADAIQNVLLSTQQPVDLQNKVVVQMGTIGPKESCDIATRIQAAGAEYLEAPVLGSQPEASKGALLIMVGSENDPQDSRAWPVLTSLGKEPMHMGAVGTAAATKLALNQLIASLTVGFSTSLGLLQRNGADIDKFMDILRGSALYAPTFDKKLQRMLDRDYSNPNFPTKHLLKDIKLFTSEAEKADLDTNLLEGLEVVITRTVLKGLGDTDYSAVHDGVIEPRSRPTA
ncbi:MAG: 3-hydroxyacid dehydrogenase [Trebouxia sp. A1-2]|nr:MAG: 3-hydroxyacid dehydrogenase [Trebouxia sp. A1-2]